MLRKFLEEPPIVRKDFFIAFSLLFNAFTWQYMTLITIESILRALNVTYTQEFIILAAYWIAIAGSSIVGSIFSNRISRFNFLCLWIILGTITSSLPVLLSNLTVIHVLTIGILLGASFGLGMPSCFAYFADCTHVENRGRIGGAILLIANLAAPFFAILFGMFNLMVNSIIFTVWRGSGLLIFFLKPEEKFASEGKKGTSFSEILHDKTFVLYFIAWIMFCFVDRFEGPIISNFIGNFFYFMRLMVPIIASFSAFIAGLLADRIGRKRMLLYGFATFGIAYAIIGIVPAALFSWYFFVVLGGISTGILSVTFILILWGDLSQSGTREKYYAIGETPLFLTNVIEVSSAQYVMQIPETSAFSVAAFFLFLAVLPLLYAPETLPERKIELRRLRKYVEKAKKVREKHAEK